MPTSTSRPPESTTREPRSRATWRSWAVAAALYVGDDRTDEDAFAQPIAGLVSVRVGPKAGSQAQFFLQEQPEVERLLDALLALVTPDAR